MLLYRVLNARYLNVSCYAAYRGHMHVSTVGKGQTAWPLGPRHFCGCSTGRMFTYWLRWMQWRSLPGAWRHNIQIRSSTITWATRGPVLKQLKGVVPENGAGCSDAASGLQGGAVLGNHLDSLQWTVAEGLSLLL